MKRTLAITLLSIGLVAAQSTIQPTVRAEELGYRVRITNLTHAQSFTPILAATHSSSVRMFLAGRRASPELRVMAEGGDVAPLTMLLSGTPGVTDIQATGGLLARGSTTRLDIAAGSTSDRLSLAAMLIPTNDGFMGINTALPTQLHEPIVVYAYAYDAGTERNNELCASIPGPSFAECGGPGGGATVGGGKGKVLIHRGIRGVGDFDANRRDWKNPVARISVQRIR